MPENRRVRMDEIMMENQLFVDVSGSTCSRWLIMRTEIVNNYD